LNEGRIEMLAGCRVLLVEDNSLIAMDLEAQLRAWGCIVHGPHATADAAAEDARHAELDAALLDIRLAHGDAIALASNLHERGVKVVFTTGCAIADLPAGLRDLPILRKPFPPEALEPILVRICPKG
jgi:CheY-like chemotaxis protein